MRKRSQDLADARAELVAALGRYDEATISLLAAARQEGRGETSSEARARRARGEPAPASPAVAASQAQAAHYRAASALRRALGRFLVVTHETPRDKALWRELCALAPGLAADARELDEERRRV